MSKADNKELENAIKVSKNLVDFYNSEDYDCFEALSYNEINAIETVLTELKRLQEENTQYKRIKKIVDSVTQEEVEEAIKRAEKEFIAKDKIQEILEEELKDINNELKERLSELSYSYLKGCKDTVKNTINRLNELI